MSLGAMPHGSAWACLLPMRPSIKRPFVSASPPTVIRKLIGAVSTAPGAASRVVKTESSKSFQNRVGKTDGLCAALLWIALGYL
jgi:hypothetical protein